MISNLRGPHPQILTCVDPATHAASPARAPHQRHDPREQAVQNKRPTKSCDVRCTKATLSKHARKFIQGGITCDLPTLGDQLKRSLVITRSLNVIAWFVRELTHKMSVGSVQGGHLTFHHQPKCNRVQQPRLQSRGALPSTYL